MTVADRVRHPVEATLDYCIKCNICNTVCPVSAVTDLFMRGEGYGVPGMRCDGMDVVDTHHVTAQALRRAREERRPLLVEAITYRFRGHSMADPEEYRTKEQVEQWRRRDPIETFGRRLVEEGVLRQEEREQLDREAVEAVDEAVAFADASPFPAPESLYDDVYVLGDQVQGWYAIDERSAGVHRGEQEREMAVEDVSDVQRYREEAQRGEQEEAGPADEAH
jgi:ferredoxin